MRRGVRLKDLPLSKQRQVRDALDLNTEDPGLILAERPYKPVSVDQATPAYEGKHNRHCPNQGWADIGGKRCFFKSTWERNVARYLEWLKVSHNIRDWFYEPQRFMFDDIKRGSNSYLPDFKVVENNGDHYWIEVKGQLSQPGRTRLKRFIKRYPTERLVFLDQDAYRALAKDLKNLIEGWE